MERLWWQWDSELLSNDYWVASMQQIGQWQGNHINGGNHGRTTRAMAGQPHWQWQWWQGQSWLNYGNDDSSQTSFSTERRHWHGAQLAWKLWREGCHWHENGEAKPISYFSHVPSPILWPNRSIQVFGHKKSDSFSHLHTWYNFGHQKFAMTAQ